MKISNTIIGAAVIGLTLGVIFFLTPALTSTAQATIIGVCVGIASSVPTAILLMALLRNERSQRSQHQQHQEQPRRRVIMVFGDGSRWMLIDDGQTPQYLQSHRGQASRSLRPLISPDEPIQ